MIALPASAGFTPPSPADFWQPLIGDGAFAALSQWGKYAHNYLAWPFMLGILFMLVVWVRDNIPNRIDWAWIKAGGGFLGDAHPSAGRFNAGQKLIFWIVVGFGSAMSVTAAMARRERRERKFMAMLP